MNGIPFFLPISFGSPLILAALLVLPLLWWLLRVTPPLPRRTPFPPLRLLRGLEDEEQTSRRHALVAAAAAPVGGGAADRGAGRSLAGPQSQAHHSRPAGAGGGQWLDRGPGLGLASGTDRRPAAQRPGPPRGDHSHRRRHTDRPAERRRSGAPRQGTEAHALARRPRRRSGGSGAFQFRRRARALLAERRHRRRQEPAAAGRDASLRQPPKSSRRPACRWDCFP